MLQTWIHRVRPEKEERLRTWLAELNSRREELRESFAAADVRAEQAFVVPGANGPLLIYVSEASNQANASTAFANSPFDIDREHLEMMRECVEETIDDPPLYDQSF